MESTCMFHGLIIGSFDWWSSFTHGRARPYSHLCITLVNGREQLERRSKGNEVWRSSLVDGMMANTLIGIFALRRTHVHESDTFGILLGRFSFIKRKESQRTSAPSLHRQHSTIITHLPPLSQANGTCFVFPLPSCPEPCWPMLNNQRSVQIQCLNAPWTYMSLGSRQGHYCDDIENCVLGRSELVDECLISLGVIIIAAGSVRFEIMLMVSTKLDHLNRSIIT